MKKKKKKEGRQRKGKLEQTKRADRAATYLDAALQKQERPTRQLGNDPALWMHEQKCALYRAPPPLPPNFSHLPALVATDLATFHSLEYPFSLSQMFLIFVRPLRWNKTTGVKEVPNFYPRTRRLWPIATFSFAINAFNQRGFIKSEHRQKCCSLDVWNVDRASSCWKNIKKGMLAM